MKTLLACICFIFFAVVPALPQSKSTVRETVLTMRTYPYSDPDPVASPSLKYYPYCRYDGFSEKGVDREWKAVELENDYIKVTLFPEIGGKIWGAEDKTTGREFIYYNHVVKFRDIAMRGPWTSGGIEFNFGILGHTPTVASPVDYFTSQNEDGSVSCHIGSYDWLTRTYWDIEVNLPADKAYFTTTTTWYNQSGTDQPYYSWMNAGFKVAGNARLYYPGNYYIGHKGELYTFPVDDQGRDRSWYEHNAFGPSKSEHVIGYYNDFYGVYWHEDGFGSVHHSAYDEKLGMKIFLWALSRNGGIWEDLLTDSDGQYMELQSGRMFNQPSEGSTFSPYKHFSFGPDLTDRWTEYWFPVEDIGGIAKASRIGALNVSRAGSDLILAFSPLGDFSKTVCVYDGDSEAAAFTIECRALQSQTITVASAGSIAEGNLKVIIGDDELVYSELEDDFRLDRPKELPSDFDWDSLYGLYTKGVQWMNQRDIVKAEYWLKKALEKDAYFAPALNRLASLYERAGRTAAALELVEKSLSMDAYDGEANYLYGLCNRREGRLVDAKDGFSVASRSAGFRSAAYTRLAEIYLLEQNYAKAEHYASLALNYNDMDLKARQVLMVVFRKTGRPDMAVSHAEQVLSTLPVYHFARFEKLYSAGGDWQTEFMSLVRNELPNETYIEMALWYESVGCIEEAVEILACAGGYPTALYLKAYLLAGACRTEESTSVLEVADAASPAGVFPFRPEMIKVFEWANAVSGCWKSKYFEGLVCWANNRPEEALNLFDGLGEPDYAPLYLTRASLKELLSPSDDSSLEDLFQAEGLDSSWRTGAALLDAFADRARWKDVVSTGERYYKKYKGNYYIGLKLARGYCEIGDYTQCTALLEGMTVLPNEGASAGHQTYRIAHLGQALDRLAKGDYKYAQTSLDKALEWPENLGTGKPFDDMIDTQIEDYVQSLILSGLKDDAGARAALEKVVAAHGADHYSGGLLSAFALRGLGRTDEADALIGAWAEGRADSAFVKWGVAVYSGDKATADTLLSSAGSGRGFADLERGLVFKLVDCIK